jgi:hypothetical protein
VSSENVQTTEGVIRVDTDKLKQGAERLTRLVERLRAAGTTFDQGCAAEGKPWGEDEGGKTFYGKYQGPHDNVVDAGHAGVKDLDTTVGQLHDLLTTLKGIEEQAAGLGKSIQGGGATGSNG